MTRSIGSFRTRIDDERGFTLVELLVVILIIGILAAIAIPSFLSQREKAQDTCAKSQVRSMSLAMESYYADSNTYSNASIGLLNAIESTISSTGSCGVGTVARVGLGIAADGGCDAGAPTAAAFCVSQSSAAGGASPTQFTITKVMGSAMIRNCGPAARQGKGGCPASGIW